MTTCDYKIGATQGGMVRLPLLGVPDPWTPPFNEFALRSTNGDGIIRGDGYPNFVWAWPVLSQSQIQVLRAFVAANTASVKLYVRTRINDGTFADFYAVMALPVLSGEDGTPAPLDIPLYESATIHFSHAVAV